MASVAVGLRSQSSSVSTAKSPHLFRSERGCHAALRLQGPLTTWGREATYASRSDRMISSRFPARRATSFLSHMALRSAHTVSPETCAACFSGKAIGEIADDGDSATGAATGLVWDMAKHSNGQLECPPRNVEGTTLGYLLREKARYCVSPTHLLCQVVITAWVCISPHARHCLALEACVPISYRKMIA